MNQYKLIKIRSLIAPGATIWSKQRSNFN